ncbi:MAG: hypothetical protein AAF383_20405 [Cyanobacteria bacterium P01_A01_bin.83]
MQKNQKCDRIDRKKTTVAEYLYLIGDRSMENQKQAIALINTKNIY